MADKRISQLVDRGTVANNDVVPIVVSGATTTNKATISSIQTFMQGNLDLGVTSVGITLGSSGTDVSVSGSPITSSGNITINLPTASATNRGLLSAADWVTFNSKQDAGSFVTLDTTQTITAQKTFTTSGSSDTMIISHGSGSGFALDVLKAGNGEAIRVTKSSGTGNAMTISGGNFEAGTIVKTGGTSSQFLKADGSVDSNTYLTTGSAGSTYVPYSGAAASVNLGVYSITANAINSAGSGSTAGQINLRSDAFFSLVNGYGSIASGTTNQFNLYQTTGAGVFRGAILSLNSITASATRTYTLPDADGTLALTSQIPTNPVGGTGAAGRVAYWNGAGTITSDSLFQWNDTFKRLGIGRTPTVSLDVEGAGYFSGALGVGGALNGTSASFTGGVSATSLNLGNGQFLRLTRTSGALQYDAFGIVAGTDNTRLISTGDFDIVNGALTSYFKVASTGAATFSSSVGVGGTNTDSLLTINGTAGTTHERFREGSTTIGFIGGANGIITGHNGKLAVRAESGLVLSGSGNSPDFIIASGGAATFSSSVTVQGGNSLFVNNASNTRSGFLRTSGEGTELSSFAGAGEPLILIAPDTSASMRFYTGGSTSASERMRITSGGFTKARANGGSSFGGGYHEFVNNNNVNGDICLVIGNVAGSNTNNTSSKHLIVADSAADRLYIYGNGNVVNVNNSYGSLSDIKLKENIEDATPKLDDLMKVKVRNYNLIGDDKKQIGVIAQELEEVFPAMIDESEDYEDVEVPQVDEEGNEILNEEGEVVTKKQIVSKGTTTKSVKYSVFVPMLIKAMQEQQEQIKSLTEQIDSLKNQIK